MYCRLLLALIPALRRLHLLRPIFLEQVLSRLDPEVLCSIRLDPRVHLPILALLVVRPPAQWCLPLWVLLKVHLRQVNLLKVLPWVPHPMDSLLPLAYLLRVPLLAVVFLGGIPSLFSISSHHHQLAVSNSLPRQLVNSHFRLVVSSHSPHLAAPRYFSKQCIPLVQHRHHPLTRLHQARRQ